MTLKEWLEKRGTNPTLSELVITARNAQNDWTGESELSNADAAARVVDRSAISRQNKALASKTVAALLEAWCAELKSRESIPAQTQTEDPALALWMRVQAGASLYRAAAYAGPKAAHAAADAFLKANPNGWSRVSEIRESAKKSCPAVVEWESWKSANADIVENVMREIERSANAGSYSNEGWQCD